MRRRKPRVVWLPQTNANSIGDFTSVYQLSVIDVEGPTGSSTSKELPLVLDSTQSATGLTDSSLSDIENSGYRLRRIVGKIFVECAQSERQLTSSNISPTSCIVTAGIMVRRAQFDGTSYAIAVGTNNEEINTGLIENTGDPWVWRRTWTLGNNGSQQLLYENPTGGEVQSRQFFPTTNFTELGGGVSDGPHVDQKTARIVSQEERLFLDWTVTILGESSDQGGTITCAMWTDLRVLGSLRTSSGNRGNASR